MKNFVKDLQEERPVDYGAMIIKGTAAVVITISMGLILLIVGNMVYQSLATKTEFRARVISSHFIFILFFNFQKAR